MNARKEKRSTRGVVLAIAASLAIAVSLAGCGGRPEAGSDAAAGPNGQNGENEVTRTAFAVNTTVVREGAIADYIRVNGDVHPVSSVDVLPDVPGELRRLHVRVGERVQVDQVIGEVDRSRPGQTFAPSPVRATISGTVIALPVSVGSMVGTGSPIARIARTDELEIRTAVAERFVSRMSLGMPATVQFDAFPGETFAARVTEVSPVLDSQTRTLGLKLTLSGRDARIKPGMFAKIQLITQRREGVVVVPSTTIVRRMGETFIFVLRDDSEHVERRQVRVGIEIDGRAEIVEGLREGEEAVYQGQSLLEDGALVRVIERRDFTDERSRS